MDHILLVGTRKTTLDSLSEMIRAQGYRLSIARNQRRARRIARQHHPDLIILDNTSARLVGEKLARTLQHLLDAPLIAIVRDHDELRSLPHTHHLIKPYTVEQLLRCIRKALQYPRELTYGPLTLNLRKRCICAPHSADPEPLTPKQFALLRLLMRHAGDVVTRKMMMVEVWNTEFMEDTRTLDVHIRWIREKIEPDPSNPRLLHTIRGTGYVLKQLEKD